MMLATIVEGRPVPVTLMLTVVPVVPLKGVMFVIVPALAGLTVNVALPPLAITTPPLTAVLVLICNACAPVTLSGQLNAALVAVALVVVQPVD